MVLPQFFGRCCAKWWCTTIVVVAFGRCYCKVAVVIATAVDSSCLADVNAKVADEIPTMGVDWQML